YENFSADHTWGESLPGRNDSDTNIRRTQVDHVITNSTKAIGAKLVFGWKFFKPFSFEAGPGFYYLFDQNFSKSKKAITPGALIISPLKDSVREYIELNGKLPDGNTFLFTLSFALGAEFPLSKKL